tara:strand:- start:35 stop:679 length:645 start_codon:yes stop_codon:yes gene_type:complete
METYGELKQAIKAISLKQKGVKIGNVAIDVALGAIPGLGAAKTTFDVVKAAFFKPDTKKTNSWLDKLDIDDEMSSIVDDTVENGFLEMITKTIESESDDSPLEQDFNMNQKMVDYLKKKYGGRTITGIKENKMRNRFQKLAGIKEVENSQQVKQDSSVTTISKDLDDQTSSFKNITTKEKMEQLLDAVVSKLDPKFKESSAFKQAVLLFFKKYK